MAEVTLRLRVDGQQAVVSGIDSVTGALDRNVQAAERDTQAQQRNAAATEQLKQQRALGIVSLREYEAQLAKLSSQQSAAAQAAAEAGAAARAQAADVEALRTKFDPAFAAAQRLTTEQQQLKRALDAGVISQQRYTELLGQMTRASATAGVSMGQIAQATRQLPLQMQDVFVSLQGGQNPLTVFMQQGSQIAGSYGSAGLALRSVGAYLAAMVTPVSAAAVAVGGVALAAYQGSREMDGYRTALTLTGNALGVTAGQMNGMAAAIRASGTATQGAASDALVEMATNGRVGKEQLQGATQAALAWGKATGASAADVAKNFADLAKDPLGGTMRLNEGMNYLTASTYQQIKALTDQGRTTEAAAVAQKAYADVMKERAPELLAQLGYLEKGWINVRDGITGAWDALKSIGREQSAEDKLADKTAIIEQTRKLIDKSDGDRAARLQNRLTALLEEQSIMQSQVREMQRAVSLRAQEAEKSKAKAEADKDGLKYLTEEQRLRKDITQETQRLRDAGASETEIAQRVAAMRYKTAIGYMQARLQAAQGLRKLNEADAEASIRHQVATEVITQEQGIKAVAALRSKALQDQAADADRLAKATAGRDPMQSAQAAAKAAELRKESANVAAQAERDLADLAYKSSRAVIDAANNAVGSEIGRRQALEESTRAIAIQTAQARQHGIVVDSVNTILEREKVALYDTALATAEKNLQDQRAQGLAADKLKGYEDAVNMLTRMRDSLKEVTAASEANDLAKAALDQTKRLTGVTDPSAPMTDFGNTLRDALGGASSGLGQMVNAMTTLNGLAKQYAQEMTVIEALRKSGDDKNIETAKQNEIALVKKQEQAQIGAYAAMASAAASYFGKQTAAYKALHGAEVTLRTYQLVMSAQAASKDLAAIGAKVSAWVTGDATMASSSVASAGVIDAVLTALGLKTAAVGIANQAQGDPYSAFPRMAAMAAMMAGLGFLVGGGSSGPGPAPTNSGTGTVFGDTNAKSESLAKSLDILNATQDVALNYSRAMAASLRSIEASMTGVTNVWLRTGGASGLESGIGTGSMDTGLIRFLKVNYLTPLDPTGILSSAITSLFGKKVSISGSGIAADAQSLGGIQNNGFQGSYYADVKTKSKFLGFTYDSSTSEKRSTLDPALERQISGIFTGIGSAVGTAADLLGQDMTSVQQRLQGYVVDIGRIDLKGLDGKQIAEKLSAVFGQQADLIAQSVIPGFESLTKVGEGYFETLTRVANEFEVVSTYTRRLGGVMGSTGLDAAKLSDSLVGLFEGLDGYQTAMADYYQSFYSDSERVAMTTSELQTAFTRLNLAMPTSTQGFRDLVNAQNKTTDAGRAALAALIQLSPEFKTVTDAATQAAQDIADQAANLQGQLDQALGNTAAIRERERAALDESNRALYDRVQAIKDQQAIDSQAANLQGQLDQALGITAAIRARELSALAPNNRALQQRIWLLAEEKTAYANAKSATDAAFSAVQRAVESEKKLTQVRMSVAQEQVTSLKNTLSVLDSGLKNLVVSTDAAAQAGQSFIDQALISAGVSGYLPDAENLQDAIGNATQGLQSKVYASSIEQQLDRAVLAAKLQDLKRLTGSQLSTAEQSLRAEQDQLTALDAVLSNAQAQLDSLRGIDRTLTSIDMAMSAFGAAAAKERQGYNAATDVYTAQSGQTYKGSTLGAEAIAMINAGKAMDLYKLAVANGVSSIDLAAMANAAGASLTVQQIIDWTKAANVPAFADGGFYAGGLAMVGEKGPELINFSAPGHIYTASQTANILNGGADKELALLLKSLIAEVQRLQSLTRDGNREVRRAADAVNGNPEQPMLVAQV